jgi:uncharacterized repeat protein (TIGR01451 family)
LIQVAGTADLSVSKTDSPDPVVAGNNITYTINFANGGPDTAAAVQVQDSVPAGTTFMAASVTSGTGWSISAPPVGGTGAVTFSKAAVASGETAVFSLVIRVNSAASSISNTVTATSSVGDPTPGNSSSTVTTGVTLFDLCVQDAMTRAILSVNTSTGSFKFTDCFKGTTLTGFGTVSRDPAMCKILFSSQSGKSSGATATASFNLCNDGGYCRGLSSRIEHAEEAERQQHPEQHL